MAEKKVIERFGDRIRRVVVECCAGDVEGYAFIMRIGRRSAYYWLDRAEPPARGLQSIRQRHESAFGVAGEWVASGAGSMWLPSAAGVAAVAARLRQYPELAARIAPEVERGVKLIKARTEDLRAIVHGLLRQGWNDRTIENHIQQMSRFEGVRLGEIRKIVVNWRKQKRHNQEASAARRRQALLHPKASSAILETEEEPPAPSGESRISVESALAYGGLR